MVPVRQSTGPPYPTPTATAFHFKASCGDATTRKLLANAFRAGQTVDIKAHPLKDLSATSACCDLQFGSPNFHAKQPPGE
jgi:hypothetical protein